MVLDNFLTVEINRSVGRRVNSCDHVERRGLSRSVGTDERYDLAFIHFNIHVIDSQNAAELHGNVFYLKDIFSHWSLLPSQLFSSWTYR